MQSHPFSRCLKIRYRNKLEAKIALASTQRAASSARGETQVYWCQECSGWHLTSRPRRRNAM